MRILLGVIVFGVSRVIRFNVLGCLLIVALLTLLGAAAQLLSQPDAFYRTNGYAVIVMMLAAACLATLRLANASVHHHLKAPLQHAHCSGYRSEAKSH